MGPQNRLTMTDVTEAARLLIPEIGSLLDKQLEVEAAHRPALADMPRDVKPSARNLLHYLALRQSDLRPLQRRLVPLGLTSLGGAEAASRAALLAVDRALRALAGVEQADLPPAPVDHRTGPAQLQQNAEDLLGIPAGKRTVRIMVTMPSEAADHPELVHDLLLAGMDVMRINCAHDDAGHWRRMVTHLRRAERETGRICRVYVDLAGPKLRTGPVEPLGRILKVRPARDPRGELLEPARVWFTPEDRMEEPPENVTASVPFQGPRLKGLNRGGTLTVEDARGKRRMLSILMCTKVSILAEVAGTCYFESGSVLRAVDDHGRVPWKATIGQLPEITEPILLEEGDELVLVRPDRTGTHAVRGADGRVTFAARIPCTLETVFHCVKPGERIFFDDGKIAGRIESRTEEEVRVRITRTGMKGGKLRPEKGINLPDTSLHITALTQKDLEDLQFVAKHADIVGLSFVRTPEDVFELQRHLTALKARRTGIVLKIENKTAFDNLPQLLLAAQRWGRAGIMVARGDLAVEVGFDRLSEVQEEILWLCEAAHVPVIWATQILESLAKKGSPSRAEVTDAVASGSAECAMLNKGPYIIEAVQFLARVLERVESHHEKKQNLLRRLAIAELPGTPAAPAAGDGDDAPPAAKRSTRRMLRG